MRGRFSMRELAARVGTHSYACSSPPGLAMSFFTSAAALAGTLGMTSAMYGASFASKPSRSRTSALMAMAPAAFRGSAPARSSTMVPPIGSPASTTVSHSFASRSRAAATSPRQSSYRGAGHVAARPCRARAAAAARRESRAWQGPAAYGRIELEVAGEPMADDDADARSRTLAPRGPGLGEGLDPGRCAPWSDGSTAGLSLGHPFIGSHRRPRVAPAARLAEASRHRSGRTRRHARTT